MVFALAAWAFSGPLAGASAPAAQGRITQTPAVVERAAVELVLVPVSVHGPDGLPVRGLTREDFVLSEDGVRQETASFDAEPTPVSLVFGLDCSGSMDKYLPFVKAAAIRFVERLPRVFSVSLMPFADTAERGSEFTDNRDHIFYEINRQKANGGGTGLLDATRSAVASLRRRPGRRAVVIFTDGGENIVPEEEMSDAAAAVLLDARSAGAMVFYVGYGWVGRTDLLDRIAAGTGGQSVPAGSERRITEAFDRIARTLGSQYTLGYIPHPGRPGEWRPIRVEVRRPAVTVSARPGYLVAGP